MPTQSEQKADIENSNSTCVNSSKSAHAGLVRSSINSTNDTKSPISALNTKGMEMKSVFSSTLLSAATGILPWTNASAAGPIKPNLQQVLYPNNPNDPAPFGFLSGAASPSIGDFHYSGQQELQASTSRLGATPDEIHANFVLHRLAT
ncbi:MAG TPA: hypothetical protein VL997_09140, partial [Dyella sp.]|nr:hypothetical protein [Dyella sp.]